MKKRIFGMLLMGAMVIASMSMFTSCKDYDDDIKANKEEITALKSQLTTELSNIRTQLASDLAAAKSELKTAIDAKANQSDVEAVKNSVASKAEASELTALVARVAALETQVLAIDDVLAKAASASDVAALNDQVVALAATLAAQTGEIDELKATIAAVKSSSQANAQAAQENAEAAAELAAEVLAASTNLGLQEAALDLLEARVAELEKQGTGIDQSVIDDLKNDIKDANAKIADLESALGNYAKLSDLRSYAKLTDLNGLAKASDLNAYAKITELAKYVQTSELANYAKKSDLNDYAKKAEFDAIKKDFQALSNKVDTFSGDINILKMYVKRNLSSINLSPDKFYGGIEGIDVFAFTPKEEKMNDKYHFFRKGNAVTLSEIGWANYHISPKTVDLSGGSVNFFTRSSDIIEPATTEQTRGVTNTNRVKAVYPKMDDMLAKNLYSKSTGILSVPYKVDNAVAIKNELAAGKGTVAALQLSQKDTTVTSDYALVVPTIAELLLICDKSFASKNTGAYWNDIPGLNNTDVNTYHLHRNFSYLAISKTTATHEIVYNKSFDISSVLLTHAVDFGETVKDTAIITTEPRATAIRYDYDPSKDSDATLLKKVCTELDDAKLAELGLYYDVHAVGYSLGSTNTEESEHIEIVKENGHFIAYPRNIDPQTGKMVPGTANASAVGRMPIVCIELKYQKGDEPAASDPTVSFAYMKFLIVKGTEPAPVSKEAEFEVSDVWADCGDASGEVAWYQIEGNVYNKLLGIDKETFDARYIFDFYQELEEQTEEDKTLWKDKRYGYRFKKTANGFAHDKDSIGQVVEEWNLSEQKKLDATTHIIKWYFSTADYIKVYKDLKARGKLAYDWEKGQMTNTEEITTYVRYAYQASYHQHNMNVKDGDPALYIKLTIPVGKFHFALGSLGGTKTLTYWYKLAKDNEAEVNAPDSKSAKEVRVNVPVPVPDAKMSVTTLSALSCPWNEALQITNDNLLERTEFLKDLHDYFRNGQLSAAVTDKTHFKKLAAKKITPEFKFTLPSTSLGNASFNATNGTWPVYGISGASYTLKLFENDTQIRISPYTEGDILCSMTKDDNDVLSVIKYHEGVKQDDILNYKKHNELGELETFAAYIMIDTPDACAPIEFDDMWFNVRFLRPCDLNDPDVDILPDAPNDWQYVDIAKYAKVYDWRDYLCDPQNRIGGNDTNVGEYKVDFKYYQISLNTDELLFLTDAGLGTNERDMHTEKDANDPDRYYKKAININADGAYKAKLWKTSEVNGLLVQKTDRKGGDQVPNSTKSTWIRYKNNSGVTGGFHIYLPIQMTYVFGNYPQTTQQKYVGLSISQSVAQVQE